MHRAMVAWCWHLLDTKRVTFATDYSKVTVFATYAIKKVQCGGKSAFWH